MRVMVPIKFNDEKYTYIYFIYIVVIIIFCLYKAYEACDESVTVSSEQTPIVRGLPCFVSDSSAMRLRLYSIAFTLFSYIYRS